MDKLDPEKLQKIDQVFARIGTADGDLFKPLVEIVEVLTNESKEIVNLIIARQEDVARQRILDGRMKLAPLKTNWQRLCRRFSNQRIPWAS